MVAIWPLWGATAGGGYATTATAQETAPECPGSGAIHSFSALGCPIKQGTSPSGPARTLMGTD